MMDAKTVDGSKRSPLWAALFLFVGGMNLVAYFHRSQFELPDLLQGVGFLAIAPWAYFNPPRLRGATVMGPRSWPPMKWLAVAGLVLALIGFALELA